MENSEIFNRDNARNIFLLIVLNYTLISRNYIGDLLSKSQIDFWKNNIWAKWLLVITTIYISSNFNLKNIFISALILFFIVRIPNLTINNINKQVNISKNKLQSTDYLTQMDGGNQVFKPSHYSPPQQVTTDPDINTVIQETNNTSNPVHTYYTNHPSDHPSDHQINHPSEHPLEHQVNNNMMRANYNHQENVPSSDIHRLLNNQQANNQPKNINDYLPSTNTTTVPIDVYYNTLEEQEHRINNMYQNLVKQGMNKQKNSHKQDVHPHDPEPLGSELHSFN